MNSLKCSVVLIALCALPGRLKSAVSAPPKTAPVPATEKAVASLARTLVDRDALRSIEVVTDRHESLAQFFARQKVALATAPMIDAHSFKAITQLQGDKPRSVFVSYPLFNDAGLQMNLYGTNLQLQPPTPAVLALFKTTPALSLYQDWLIFAFDDDKSSRTFPTPRSRPARLVGCIRINDKWSPPSEKELFAFFPPTT